MKFLIILITFLFLLSPSLVVSQTSQSQEYRLEQIDKLSATASSKTATTAAKSKKTKIGFIEGKIIFISGNSISLNTPNGTKLVTTTDSSLFFNLDSTGRKLIGLGDLKTGDELCVIGLAQNSTAGFGMIIVRDQNKTVENFSAFGTISEFTGTNLKINNITSTSLTTPMFALTTELSISNSKRQKLKLSDLKLTDLIATSGYIDEKNNLITSTLLKIN